MGGALFIRKKTTSLSSGYKPSHLNHFNLIFFFFLCFVTFMKCFTKLVKYVICSFTRIVFLLFELVLFPFQSKKMNNVLCFIM